LYIDKVSITLGANSVTRFIVKNIFLTRNEKERMDRVKKIIIEQINRSIR